MSHKVGDKISLLYKEKKPFVVFASPFENHINLLAQKDNTSFTSEEVKEDVFIFAPFNTIEPLLYIPYEEATLEKFTNNFGIEYPPLLNIKDKELDKESYLSLLKKTIQFLNTTEASKVVISRKQDIQLINFNFTTLVKSLFSKYQEAFKYIWYHPQSGIWIGATPELLLSTKEGGFSTMALAGTKPIDIENKIVWSEKEKIEHEYVVDAITQTIGKALSVYKVSKTYTHQAGSLAHLRTDITGILNKNKNTFTTILNALHPTPAVCGTPREHAKKYILENEGYARSFYTGYLGNLSCYKGTSSLYVNLRCAKIENNQATLYVGGGITKDSIPENEWEETQNKMQTMLAVLSAFL